MQLLAWHQPAAGSTTQNIGKMRNADCCLHGGCLVRNVVPGHGVPKLYGRVCRLCLPLLKCGGTYLDAAALCGTAPTARPAPSSPCLARPLGRLCNAKSRM